MSRTTARFAARRSRAIALAAIVASTAVACSGAPSASAPPDRSQADRAQADHAPSGGAEASSGAVLQTDSAVFDPVADDVAGTEACEGRAGREALASFERAAWPEGDFASGEAVLRCGNADGSGWRHIADGHTGDFAELAELVGASWEDVAWFAITEALADPDRIERYRDDIANYDVVVSYLVDGDVAADWMVTVGVGMTSGQIITSFPDDSWR